MKIIGLTGSIATGKSFVASIIKNQMKYPLIDADKLAREIVEVNKPAYLEIVKNFGENILKSKEHPLGGLGAPINRKELRNIIFDNENQRKILNQITHKYIREEFLKKVENYKNSGEKIVFYDVPLLFEVKLEKQFYKIVVVYTPKKIQIERLMKRDNIDYDSALKTIKSQIDIEIKKEKADFVIDNSKDKENTYKQVKTMINHISTEIVKGD